MVIIHYTGSKDNTNPFIQQIQSVINNLPKDIQQRIHVDCMIFIIDTCYGYYIRESNEKIILFNINQMKKDKLSIRDQDYIIAHEYAHFILNHIESSTKEESEAEDLVVHWGFSKDRH